MVVAETGARRFARIRPRALLVKQQYVEVPLRRTKFASLDVAAKIEGDSLLLYLDTGNTDNMIEPAVAQRLKLRSQLASHGITVLKETAPRGRSFWRACPSAACDPRLPPCWLSKITPTPCAKS